MTKQPCECGTRLFSIVCGALLLTLSLGNDSFAQITLRGTANPIVNIIAGTAGGSMTPVVNTSSSVRYNKQSRICKITVRTTCPTQAFHLSVVATGVTYGVAQPVVDLVNGMTAVDFIRDIPSTGFWTRSTVTLQYTASADFSDGNSAEMGDDVHTVTYTLLAQ